MPRARGSDATMQFRREATYGTPPINGYKTLPFVSSALGATQGLIESDLLGQGRAPFDPTADVIVNDGDVVVPVEPRSFGYWLMLLMGSPVTTGSAAPYLHTFDSGADDLPSASIPIGHPRVPSFSTNYGVKANTLRIAQNRSGLLNATIGLIAKGETTPAPTTTIATPAEIDAPIRFAQASGSIWIDDLQVGSIVEASFTFTNNLDKIETIQPDGEIEQADPGMPAASGQLRTRFADHTLLTRAISRTPVTIEHKWVVGDYSLLIRFPRVFLPRPKREISGPGGIMADFDWQASGQTSFKRMMRAMLTSPVQSFG
jgi:hypothetical protein